MPRSEHIGVDPVWQRIVLPSTACLRLGFLLGLVCAGFFQVQVAFVVKAVAVAMAVLYAAGYAAVWSRKLPSAVLAYAVLGDAFLLGGLAAGAGGHAPLAGPLCLLILALAHMCGGVRLGLSALAAMIAGWVAVHLSGVEGLVASDSWRLQDFRLALDTETTYGGQVVGAAGQRQVMRAAVASFFLISLSGCIAFARARWERARVTQVCAEVDALEAIVDCYTASSSVQELWRIVSRSASLVSGALVVTAYVDDERVRLAGNPENEGEFGTLRGLRLDVRARDNLIVHSLMSGREAETENVGDLWAGSEQEPSNRRTRRHTRYLVVPITSGENGAALIAEVHGKAAPALEGLRLVAERAALVLRARGSQQARFGLEPAPAGA